MPLPLGAVANRLSLRENRVNGGRVLKCPDNRNMPVSGIISPVEQGLSASSAYVLNCHMSGLSFSSLTFRKK
jgi:hypothetical protein